MSFWRPIDCMARWLGRNMGAENQLRLGILLVILSLPLYGYAPFSGEPLLIYLRGGEYGPRRRGLPLTPGNFPVTV